MEDLKIEVRLQDIYEGWKGDSSYCPVARAVQREFPTARNIDVDGLIISFDYPEYEGYFVVTERFTLPWPAARFIEDFDNGKEVLPIQFTAEWVEPEPEKITLVDLINRFIQEKHPSEEDIKILNSLIGFTVRQLEKLEGI